MATLAPDVAAESSPVRVTTDTYEYCSVLAQRLAALPQSREEPARSLGEDGQRLCSSGHVRTGVAKLRRALRAAQSAQAAPSPSAPPGTQASGH